MGNDLLKNYLHGRSCDVLGFGVSHIPLCRLLSDMGLTLTVRDQKSAAELGEDALALQLAGVSFTSGRDCFEHLRGQVIFRSPGIRPDISPIAEAVARGAELTGEIGLFLELTPTETFGITGSDGKTTSTTLTGKFLEAEAVRSRIGQVYIGGNIGTPLLDRLGDMNEGDRAVMELSSFQLMTAKTAPHYAAITNLSPNHLDWHTGMDEYLAAKKNIIGKNTRRLVTNAACSVTAELAAELICRKKQGEQELPAIYLFSSQKSSFAELFPHGALHEDRAIYEKEGKILLSDGKCEEVLLDTASIRIPGRHNIENYMTAMGLTYGKVHSSVYTQVAESFFGVEHRLELVRTLHEVDYYNSSIDSSPSRTAAALSALNGRDTVVICGGYDKKIPFAPLAEALCRHARAVVLTGATAEKIRDALSACPDYRDGCPEIRLVPDFADAVLAAKALAREGGCVLLSPACASFDAFQNFAHRGNTFRTLVQALEN